MWLGWLELIGLSGLAWLSALSLGLRVRWSGRAELFAGTAILTHAMITAPTLALGWTGLLYRSVLALTSALVSLAGLGAAFALSRQSPRAFREELGQNARALLRLPYDAFALAFARPGFTLVGLAASAIAIGWTAWASYLTPSSSWDGLWYHESIVGFALQNHGFRFLEPMTPSLAYVNTFPRNCEMMNLWFVAFTDRRLIDAVNTAMAPLMLVAFYLLARRYVDRLSAMGWATVFLLVPGVVLQMRSTYIDLHIGALMIAAMYFVTRPEYRLRDAWVTAICLALLIGTKFHALMWVPPLGAVHLGRLFAAHRKTNPRGAWANVAGTAALVALVAAPVHIRNWLRYHNPVYPIAIDSARFDLHLPGTQHVDDILRPFSVVLAETYTHHVPGNDYFDTKVHSYGMALSWVVLPLAAIALPWAVVAVVRGLARLGPRDGSAENLLLVTLPALATAFISPAVWLARYNVHVAGALILAAAWVGSRVQLKRLGEGGLGAAVILSVMMLYWADPGWGITAKQVGELAALSAEDRAAYEWPMYAVPTKAAHAREKELGPGDVTVFTDEGTFFSVLWNEHFTNSIVYTPFQEPDFFRQKLAELHAKWTVAQLGSREYNVLRADAADWEEIGILTSTGQWVAFRRRRS